MLPRLHFRFIYVNLLREGILKSVFYCTSKSINYEESALCSHQHQVFVRVEGHKCPFSLICYALNQRL